ncbi:putative folic acid synthesis protein [Erysiphe necator]|uniref:Folic acid synthesis protein FOL1 n=1 Tax=Uncinula necator TaxID=52586 RepID=A0A0B1PB66_UNCNE|nr:putative folic acid synthesis protein [Erysiphe necator]
MLLKNISHSTCRKIFKPGINGKTSVIRLHWSTTFSRQWSSIKQPSWTSHAFKDAGDIKHEARKRSKTVAYISLGSNIGNRIKWIEEACNRISERGIRIRRTSSLWETKPMYVLEQENFINGVIEVETEFQPLDLLDQLQNIEKELGRTKIIDKGPRNIDLDILLYGNETVHHERLQIPHPGITEREFVLRPLSELIPQKPLFISSPWKFTQDYLNRLPMSNISTVTPLADGVEPIKSMKCDRKTQIMAIFNLTPDSFSDGRKNSQPLSNQEIINRIQVYLNDGASIIDIGGQSSRPFAKEISFEEEINRIAPAIHLAQHQKKIDSKATNFAISVDTYRAKVAEAAVRSGADIINDISAGRLDPEMLPTMARLGKTVCLTHMRGTPSTMTNLSQYPEGLIPTIAKELIERVEAAQAAGIRRWRIILDPGIGFAKNLKQNLELLRRLNELKDWPELQGFPWMIGSSRKSFIGTITGVEKPVERIWGTSATVTAAISGGADIVRVHDVKEMTQVVRISDAIWRI